jgi:hypothetical protein
LSDFIAPFAAVLPDARLRQVVPLAVRGIVAGESPLVVTAMAQSVARIGGGGGGSEQEEKRRRRRTRCGPPPSASTVSWAIRD